MLVIFVSGWCVAVTGFYQPNRDDDDDDNDDEQGRKARGKEKNVWLIFTVPSTFALINLHNKRDSSARDCTA